MKRPETGLCLPCTLERVRDGDTVEVRIGGAYVWALRLIDCWAPELNTEKGRKAKEFAERIVEAADLYVHIPLPKNGKNLLKNLTFDRIPAYLYVGDHSTLNEIMVNQGFATARKESPCLRR